MNWYQVVLLLVTIVCIGAPMLYVFGIKEKEMHPNVEEVHDIQALRLENAKLRELVRDMRNAFFALDIDHCQKGEFHERVEFEEPKGMA